MLQVAQQVMQYGARPPALPHCPPPLAALMARCWAEEPADRCSGQGEGGSGEEGGREWGGRREGVGRREGGTEGGAREGAQARCCCSVLLIHN